MKALYYPRFDELRIEELAAPTPAAGEVTVRVAACGLCGSELESFKNRSPRRQPPLVMGHEFCGVVDDVGAGVDRSLVGRRVVSNSLVPCNRCVRCKRGDTHLCAHRQIFGMHRAGAFAERVAVPADVLLAWPDELTASAACLAEPLGNGIHVVNLTRHLPAATAIVIGAGPIGLMCQQALQTLRGTRVMVADLSAGRLTVATRLGAERTLVTKDADLPTEARAWTDGEGVDLVVDAAGSATTKRLSIAALRPGGAAVWIGLHGDKMEIDSYQVTLPERQILGTYAAKKEELAEALELMRTGRVEVASWVETAPLESAVGVFHRMLSPGDADIKAVFTP
ncbi:MAG: alcohol dehydrogenase catalytic domain-containing protein [Opitutaceae bacterium]